MVMPRSRSMSIESSTCASISRSEEAAAKVDDPVGQGGLPWSMWAMIEKFLMCCMGHEKGAGGHP